MIRYYAYANDELFYRSDTDDPAYQMLDISLEEELNKTTTLQFVLLPSNVKYNALTPMSTLIVLRTDERDLFRGRVVNSSEIDIYGQKTVKCESVMSFLMDSVFVPSVSTAKISSANKGKKKSEVDDAMDDIQTVMQKILDGDYSGAISTATSTLTHVASEVWTKVKDGASYTYNYFANGGSVSGFVSNVGNSVKNLLTNYFSGGSQSSVDNRTGDTSAPVTETPREYFARVLISHNMQVEPYKRIWPGNITIDEADEQATLGSESVCDTYSALDGGLLKNYGGYFRLRYENDGSCFMDYLKTYNESSSQALELGVNIEEITYSEDSENLFTVLLPLGKNNGTIANVNNGDMFLESPTYVERYGHITLIKTWDDISDPNELMSKALAYLNKHCSEIPVKMEVTAIDLHLLDDTVDEVCLGDTVTVSCPARGISQNKTVLKISRRLLELDDTTYTIGDDTDNDIDTTAGYRNGGSSGMSGLYVDEDGILNRDGISFNIANEFKVTASKIVLNAKNNTKEFSDKETYTVGAIRIGPDGNVYKAKHAIEEAGEWNEKDWERASMDIGMLYMVSRITRIEAETIELIASMIEMKGNVAIYAGDILNVSKNMYNISDVIVNMAVVSYTHANLIWNEAKDIVNIADNLYTVADNVVTIANNMYLQAHNLHIVADYVETEIGMLKETIGTWDQKIGTWTQSIGDWYQVIDTWTQSINHWNQYINTWTQSIGNWDQTIDVWTQSIGTWIQSIGYWQQSIGTWIQSIGYWQQSIGTWVQSIGYWQQSIGTWVQSIDIWQQSIGKWYQDIGEWRQDIDLWVQSVGTWYQDIDIWHQDIGTWYQDVDTWWQNISLWHQDIDAWTQSIGSWQQSIGSWVQSIDTWQQSIGNWITSIGNWDLTIASLSASIGNAWVEIGNYAQVAGDVSNLEERVGTIEGSALWQTENNIQAVVGKFSVDGSGNLHVADGSGLYLGTGNASVGVYTEGMLTAGVIAEKLTGQSPTESKTALRLIGDEIDIRGNATIQGILTVRKIGAQEYYVLNSDLKIDDGGNMLSLTSHTHQINVNSDGQISISGPVASASNPNLADTSWYKGKVSALKDAAAAAIGNAGWAGLGNSSSLTISASFDGPNKRIHINNATCQIAWPGESGRTTYNVGIGDLDISSALDAYVNEHSQSVSKGIALTWADGTLDISLDSDSTVTESSISFSRGSIEDYGSAYVIEILANGQHVGAGFYVDKSAFPGSSTSNTYNSGWINAASRVSINAGGWSSTSFGINRPSTTTSNENGTPLTFFISASAPSASGGHAYVQSYDGSYMAAVDISNWWTEAYAAGQSAGGGSSTPRGIVVGSWSGGQADIYLSSDSQTTETSIVLSRGSIQWDGSVATVTVNANGVSSGLEIPVNAADSPAWGTGEGTPTQKGVLKGSWSGGSLDISMSDQSTLQQTSISLSQGTGSWSGGIGTIPVLDGGDTGFGVSVRLAADTISWDGNIATISVEANGVSTGLNIQVDATGHGSGSGSSTQKGVVKGSWNSGYVSFSLSESSSFQSASVYLQQGTASWTNGYGIIPVLDNTSSTGYNISVRLAAGTISWDGSTATIPITANGSSTGLSIRVDATGHGSGSGSSTQKGIVKGSWSGGRVVFSLSDSSSLSSASVVLSQGQASWTNGNATIPIYDSNGSSSVYNATASLPTLTTSTTWGGYENLYATVTVKHGTATAATATVFVGDSPGISAYQQNAYDMGYAAGQADASSSGSSIEGWNLAVSSEHLELPKANSSNSTFSLKYPANTYASHTTVRYTLSTDSTASASGKAYVKQGSTTIAALDIGSWYNAGYDAVTATVGSWSSGKLTVSLPSTTGGVSRSKTIPAPTISNESVGLYDSTNNRYRVTVTVGGAQQYTYHSASLAYEAGWRDAVNKISLPSSGSGASNTFTVPSTTVGQTETHNITTSHDVTIRNVASGRYATSGYAYVYIDGNVVAQRAISTSWP